MSRAIVGERSVGEQAQATLETLRSWPWIATLRTLRSRFREDRLGLTASSLTFTTLIALVPLLTVMLAVFTAFPMFSSFEAALDKYFLQSLVPDDIATPVLALADPVRGQGRAAGRRRPGACWSCTALALVLTIDRTLNAIWRVRTAAPDRTARPRLLGRHDARAAGCWA